MREADKPTIGSFFRILPQFKAERFGRGIDPSAKQLSAVRFAVLWGLAVRRGVQLPRSRISPSWQGSVITLSQVALGREIGQWRQREVGDLSIQVAELKYHKGTLRPRSTLGSKRPPRVRRGMAFAYVLGSCLCLVAPGAVQASLILDSSREPHLDPRSPALLHAPLPHQASIAEACDVPSSQAGDHSRHDEQGASAAERPSPAIPLATSLTPDDGSLAQSGQTSNELSTGQGVFGVNGSGVQGKASVGGPTVIDQIRGRIALIESCRLHLEQLLTALRSGLLKDLVRVTSNVPVAYSSGETTKHNFPKSKIKTVKLRYDPDAGTRKKKSNGSAQQTPKGWGFSRFSITIKSFIIELFSYVYTYVFIIVFGFLTLYFRHYLNKT